MIIANKESSKLTSFILRFKQLQKNIAFAF